MLISSQTFVSLVLDLSLCSLSLVLSDTQIILEALYHWRKDKKNKREEKIREGRVGSRDYNKITCRYQVPYMISLLVLACMVHACVFLVLNVIGMGLSRCDCGFQPLLAIFGLSCYDGVLFFWLSQISEWFSKLSGLVLGEKHKAYESIDR